jgi:hypothetical protein
MATRMWVASTCMWCESDLKTVLALYGSKKLGCIHLYVVQIKPKNYIKVQGINKL